MQISGIAGGVLFVIGIAAIFTSSGNTMNMTIGDVLVFAAGLAMVFLGGKQPAA